MKSCMKYTYRSSKFTLICDHIDEILIFVSDEVLEKCPRNLVTINERKYSNFEENGPNSKTKVQKSS